MMIKTERRRQALSIRALATKAKMSYTYLSNVENGKVDPSLSTLKRIAKALGITVSELIREPKSKPRR